MRSAVDLEYSGKFDTELNERKVESEKSRSGEVLGMVFSRDFKLVFNNGNPFSDNILKGP